MNTLDWYAVTIDENDLDLIYNRLLEKETPMTPLQLAETVIDNRIKEYKKTSKEESKKNDQYYRPGKNYSIGDVIEFPLNDGVKGTVETIRDGINPAFGSFSVMTVLLVYVRCFQHHCLLL